MAGSGIRQKRREVERGGRAREEEGREERERGGGGQRMRLPQDEGGVGGWDRRSCDM